MPEFQAVSAGEMVAGKFLTGPLLARLRNNLQGLAEGKGTLVQKVVTGAIAANSIPGTAWKDDSIPSAKIGANLIGDSQIAAGAITASKLKLAYDNRAVAVNAAGTTSYNIANLKWKIGYKTWAEMNAGVPCTYRFILGFENDDGTGYNNTSEMNIFGMKDVYGHAGAYGYIYFWFSYLDASPPYDLGDGEIPLFVYLKQLPGGALEEMTCNTSPPWYDSADSPVVRRDLAPDGTTRKFRSIRALPPKPTDWSDKTARSAYLAALRTPTQDLAPEEMEEITPATKNERMIDRPHPFMSVQPTHRVALIEPAGDFAHQLAAIHDDGGNVLSLLQHGYIELTDDLPTRAGPPGVTILGARWRNTGRLTTTRPKPFR